MFQNVFFFLFTVCCVLNIDSWHTGLWSFCVNQWVSTWGLYHSRITNRQLGRIHYAGLLKNKLKRKQTKRGGTYQNLSNRNSRFPFRINGLFFKTFWNRIALMNTPQVLTLGVCCTASAQRPRLFVARPIAALISGCTKMFLYVWFCTELAFVAVY